MAWFNEILDALEAKYQEFDDDYAYEDHYGDDYGDYEGDEFYRDEL